MKKIILLAILGVGFMFTTIVPAQAQTGPRIGRASFQWSNSFPPDPVTQYWDCNYSALSSMVVIKYQNTWSYASCGLSYAFVHRKSWGDEVISATAVYDASGTVTLSLVGRTPGIALYLRIRPVSMYGGQKMENTTELYNY